jgi:HEPN domain-containing protein
MPTTDARDPQAWFDFAAKDLERAHRRSAEGDLQDSLFHLQQCAEKVMKGKLIGLGWNLKKTHELGILLLDLKAHQVDCAWFEDTAEVLTAEYIADAIQASPTSPWTPSPCVASWQIPLSCSKNFPAGRTAARRHLWNPPRQRPARPSSLSDLALKR